MKEPLRLLLPLAGIIVLASASWIHAQHVIRLHDGGVLEGEIIRETETSIDLKHETFGVINIPRSKIKEMGAYGTLPSSDEAQEPEEPISSRSRRGFRSRGTTGSRLDLDGGAQVPPVPPSIEKASPADPLLAEMQERPGLARIYQALVNDEALGEDHADIILELNNKLENEPDSLSLLEDRILQILLGEFEAESAATVVEDPWVGAPADLVPIVDEIRGNIESIQELRYQELYTVNNPLGKVVIRYDRQGQVPKLAAGSSEVLEHVNPAKVGRAVRYFSDGRMIWLLTREGSNAEGSSGSPPAPSAARVDFGDWLDSGLPVDEMSRARLLLNPFASLALETLTLKAEDEQEWVFTAEVDSPAFSPMDKAELQIEKATGLLRRLKLEGSSLNAEIEISMMQVDPGLPPNTFVIPESPNGETFDPLDPPGSAIEALSVLGAL